MVINIYTYTDNRDNHASKTCHAAFKLVAEKDGQVIKETKPRICLVHDNWWGSAIKVLILALEELTDPIECEWWIYTDTPYVETNFEYAYKWRDEDWLKDGKPRAHSDAWKELLSMIDQFSVKPHISSGEHIYTHELIETVEKAKNG